MYMCDYIAMYDPDVSSHAFSGGKHTVPNCIVHKVATNFSHFSDNYKHNITVRLNTVKLTLVTSGIISTALKPSVWRCTSILNLYVLGTPIGHGVERSL